MQVADLIKELQDFNPNADVVFGNVERSRMDAKIIAVTAGDECCYVQAGKDDTGDFVALY